MRALGWSAVALVLVGGVVVADPAKPDPAPEKKAPPKPDKAKPDKAKADLVDISTYKADLLVLSDDDGVMYIVRPKAVGRDNGPVFVGDGKVFYEQQITTAGAAGDVGSWSYGLWAPRVPGFDDAQLFRKPDKRYYVSCGNTERQTELRALGTKEADKVLASAELRPRLHNRKSHLLARDDDGTYYYVDIDRDEKGDSINASRFERRYQHGHRVFVGKKGAMKELPMTNVVADSEGEIYQTKRGELRIVTENDKTGYWVRGRKKTMLKLLDLDDNRYLIYRELGVFGFIGTACEEL